MYNLVLRSPDGSDRTLRYDPLTSLTEWADTGEELNLSKLDLDPAEHQEWNVAFPVHPTNPAGKSRKPKSLKIQMGLKCNYSCSYCNQASQPHDSEGNPKQVARFLEKLPTWFELSDEVFDIEFWGGEPFVYWKTMKPLAEGIRELYPNANFSVITNGSLLDKDKVDWLRDYGFNVTVSHDGPAYEAGRGLDPLMNDEQRGWIKYALDTIGRSKFAFNCVLSAHNFSLDAVRQHIATHLGVDPDSFSLWTEEILLPYDEGGLKLSVLNEQQAVDLMHTVFSEAATGVSTKSPAVMNKMKEFAESLRDKRPASSLGQKCGMDREDNIAIDLNGNVLTCQNTSPLTKHRIGHMEAFDHIKLTTAYHWTTRDECKQCPLVQLCQGACLFLEDKLWLTACNNSFAYNAGIMAAVLFHITGMILIEIQRDAGIRHPAITFNKIIRV